MLCTEVCPIGKEAELPSDREARKRLRRVNLWVRLW